MIYKKKFNKDQKLEKNELLFSFNSLLHQVENDGDGGKVQMSLHWEYDYNLDRDKFTNEDIEVYLIPYDSPQTQEFIKKWEFEEASSLPENLKLLLGTHGMAVSYLEEF